MFPMHWGSITLAYHAWTEPMERVLASAGDARIVVARPGESVEPAAVSDVTRWWPTIAWQSAQEHPVVSSQLE